MMNVLELAQPAIFDNVEAETIQFLDAPIQFLDWVDPDASAEDGDFGSKFMEDFSQETAFPTLQIATQLKDFASPDYTWQPVPSPVLGGLTANQNIVNLFAQAVQTSKTKKKKLINKKIRKRKAITKRTDFDKGTRSKSETGFRGVRFSTNGCRFRATVNVNKKPFNVGTFDTAKEAAQQYDKALIQITHGRVERSRLNFPNRWTLLYQQVRQARSKTYSELDCTDGHFEEQKLVVW